tara:strand:+ start:4179 stop:5075 length:897 start_codon:yes stop_codon:yes gene_type:complete
MNANQVKEYFCTLQDKIIERLEEVDGEHFRREKWERPEGGGGLSCVIEKGNIFEKGGVNFSHVFGLGLPASATAARPELSGRSFEAMGVSIVLHPYNPYAPTIHLNVRFLEARKVGAESVWWFGGGMDLTPYYGFEEDAKHFHQVCKDSLQPFGDEYHKKFKKWCDKYFYLKHRNEPRGIGGIFFDDLSQPDFETCFEITKNVGNHFIPAYVPILERRINMPYGEHERDFQAYRRGRYVEFNLVWDRGTLFGLQSGGRTESILMSLPPIVKWRYDWKPEKNSEESNLYNNFLIGKDWV